MLLELEILQSPGSCWPVKLLLMKPVFAFWSSQLKPLDLWVKLQSHWKLRESGMIVPYRIQHEQKCLFPTQVCFHISNVVQSLSTLSYLQSDTIGGMQVVSSLLLSGRATFFQQLIVLTCSLAFLTCHQPNPPGNWVIDSLWLYKPMGCVDEHRYVSMKSHPH